MKTTLEQQSSKTRKDAQLSKIDLLAPEQKTALIHWLTVDRVTYETAVSRMKEQFRVSLAISSLCRWWRKNYLTPPAQQNPLLDVIIQSSAPVRLIVRSKDEGVSLSQEKAPSDFEI